MGTTTSGLPWPDPTALFANTDTALKALAEAILAPVDLGLAAAAGWTLNSSACYLVGTRALWIDIDMTRTGAAIIADATGNVAPDVDIATAANRRPVRDGFLRGHRPGVSTWGVRYTTAGVFQLTDGYPTASTAAGGMLLRGLVNLL